MRKVPYGIFCSNHFVSMDYNQDVFAYICPICEKECKPLQTQHRETKVDTNDSENNQ